MILKELYDKVTLVNPCSKAAFLTHFDTSVRALIARYGKRYVVLRNAVYSKPVNDEEDVPIYDEYMVALYSNILYLLTQNPDRKTDYLAEAEDAYKTVHTRRIRGVKFRDADYPFFY